MTLLRKNKIKLKITQKNIEIIDKNYFSLHKLTYFIMKLFIIKNKVFLYL